LLAAGHRPNTDTLNAAAAGVETDDAGFVETDEYLRTTADGVWALGDIVGEYLLKHNANHEARAVVRNLFGDPEPVDYTAMPVAVFASPEVAGVGATEDELDGEYTTNTYRHEDTARSDAMQTEGLVTVVVDLEGDILGCHIMGPEASNPVQEVVVAMTAGSGTVETSAIRFTSTDALGGRPARLLRAVLPGRHRPSARLRPRPLTGPDATAVGTATEPLRTATTGHTVEPSPAPGRNFGATGRTVRAVETSPAVVTAGRARTRADGLVQAAPGHHRYILHRHVPEIQ